MMTVSRQQMQNETRRRFIVDAARRLLAKNGIENTTMEDIAGAADYTRRTLYIYFSSFDEICLSVMLDDQEIRWQRQKEAVAAADTGLAKLRAWARALWTFVQENPQYIRLEIYWDYHGLDPDHLERSLFTRFRKRNDELAEGLRDIFHLGIEDGSMRSDLEIDICISQFLYSFRSVLNRAVSSGYSFARFEPDKYVQHYLDLFCRGIRNPGENRK